MTSLKGHVCVPASLCEEPPPHTQPFFQKSERPLFLSLLWWRKSSCSSYEVIDWYIESTARLLSSPMGLQLLPCLLAAAGIHISPSCISDREYLMSYEFDVCPQKSSPPSYSFTNQNCMQMNKKGRLDTLHNLCCSLLGSPEKPSKHGAFTNWNDLFHGCLFISRILFRAYFLFFSFSEVLLFGIKKSPSFKENFWILQAVHVAFKQR